MSLPRLLLLLLALGAAAPAHALLDEVPWEATRIVRIDGRTIETRVHHDRRKERISATVQGVQLDLVMRYDLGRMWQMTPLFSLAGETDLSQLDTPASIKVLARERLTKEKVAGQDCAKYRLQFQTRDGVRREGFYWQNAAGVHLKSRFAVPDEQGKVHQVELELRDLKPGPQAAALFELPADYRVMPVDTGMLRDLLGF